MYVLEICFNSNCCVYAQTKNFASNLIGALQGCQTGILRVASKIHGLWTKNRFGIDQLF